MFNDPFIQRKLEGVTEFECAQCGKRTDNPYRWLFLGVCQNNDMQDVKELLFFCSEKHNLEYHKTHPGLYGRGGQLLVDKGSDETPKP